MTVSRAGGEICAGSDDVVGGASDIGAGICDGVACGVCGIRGGSDDVACVVLAAVVPRVIAVFVAGEVRWAISAVLPGSVLPAATLFGERSLASIKARFA